MAMEQFECIELDDQVSNVSVVRFKDKKVMDPARIEQLGVELLTLVNDGKPDNVLINFEDVNFFSSAAINKLIVLEKRVRARGGKIRLSNLAPVVRDLFSYTNLDSMFQIDPDQQQAIDSFADNQ
jgi:anti-anti-sigma factor